MRQDRVADMAKDKSGPDKAWRYEISERIDQLVKMSRKTNVEVASDIGVTKEAIRLWREGTNWPRMDKIKALAEVLATTPDFILLGVQAERKGMELRERICRNDAELALLRLFRATNREGKNLTIEAARSYSITHSAPHNVVQLKDRRKG
jgi:transcriptional regulator with XRE-family HTH domain